MMWWIRHKPSGEVLRINERHQGCPQLGRRFYLGYQSLAYAVLAIKQHGLMQVKGWHWRDLELVNDLGLTMDEMKAVEVKAGGYALRHREGWYWMNLSTRRIWYAKPDRAEAAWTQEEAGDAAFQMRKVRKLTAKRRFDMVLGLAGGAVEVMDMWFV